MHYFDYLKKTFVTKNDFYCKKEDQFSTVVSNSNLYADHILNKRINVHAPRHGPFYEEKRLSRIVGLKSIPFYFVNFWTQQRLCGRVSSHVFDRALENLTNTKKFCLIDKCVIFACHSVVKQKRPFCTRQLFGDNSIKDCSCKKS